VAAWQEDRKSTFGPLLSSGRSALAKNEQVYVNQVIFKWKIHCIHIRKCFRFAKINYQNAFLLSY